MEDYEKRRKKKDKAKEKAGQYSTKHVRIQIALAEKVAMKK